MSFKSYGMACEKCQIVFDYKDAPLKCLICEYPTRPFESNMYGVMWSSRTRIREDAGFWIHSKLWDLYKYVKESREQDVSISTVSGRLKGLLHKFKKILK